MKRLLQAIQLIGALILSFIAITFTLLWALCFIAVAALALALCLLPIIPLLFH